jgi:hypothetical protein
MNIDELRRILEEAEPGKAAEGLQIHDGWRAIVRSVGDGRFAVDVENEAEPWFSLVSVAEIAQRAGVAWSTVQSWRRRHADFPAPLVTLAAGPVWDWADVERWIAVPRPQGRPRKG